MHQWDELYGLPVLRGEIITGKLVYLAVERHYKDLKHGHKRGLEFSPGHAWDVINFIQKNFVHIKGPLARQPILLDPWQLFWTAVLYGWLKANGLRRFSRGYEEVARKNGKSTWKGPQGAYLFMMDREIGAEVYAVATTREQAMSVYKPAFDNFKRWARRSPGVKRSFSIHEGKNQEQISFESSVFKPLPANADSLDGLNPHAILFDELHAQKSSDVWDVMESALGARTQPLLSAITTAGFILDGICTDLRSYLINILTGTSEDDSFFGYVYTLDADDNPLDPEVWIKANPGLDKSKSRDYMHTMAKKAAALPSALANFKTKDLNIWCNTSDGWFDISVWDKGKKSIDIMALRGRKCFAGMDLAATRDLTSLSLVFPPYAVNDEWIVLNWNFCPQAKVDEHSKDDAAPYAKWAKTGALTVTEGDVTDYTPMRNKIKEVRQLYDVAELGFDKWNATHLVNEIAEDNPDLVLVEVPQNTGGMHPGSKLLEELVYGKRWRHGGNPVLRWAAGNVALLFDSNGNFRPDKKRSNDNGRIDPIVATVMALSRASVHVSSEITQGFVQL